MSKFYKKLNELPHATASNDIIDGCLVLEGGAFRIMFTEGMLDYLMEQGINLSHVVGCSAGGMAGLSYASGQIGRSIYLNLRYRNDSRYLGIKAILKSHNLIDVDFIMKDAQKEVPFDSDRFDSMRQKLIVNATNLLTGKSDYFEHGKCESIYEAIKASASMPYISHPVMIDSVPYLDGGCSERVPIDYALKNNFKKIIVVRTRDKKFRRYDKPNDFMVKLFYSKYPNFIRALKSSSEDYNKLLDNIDALEKEGRILVIAPKKPVTIPRLESDVDKLATLYYEGYEQGKEELQRVKEYLKI